MSCETCSIQKKVYHINLVQRSDVKSLEKELRLMRYVGRTEYRTLKDGKRMVDITIKDSACDKPVIIMFNSNGEVIQIIGNAQDIRRLSLRQFWEICCCEKKPKKRKTDVFCGELIPEGFGDMTYWQPRRS